MVGLSIAELPASAQSPGFWVRGLHGEVLVHSPVQLWVSDAFLAQRVLIPLPLLGDVAGSQC